MASDPPIDLQTPEYKTATNLLKSILSFQIAHQSVDEKLCLDPIWYPKPVVYSTITLM